VAELRQRFTSGALIGNGNPVTVANSDDTGEAPVSTLSLTGGTINYENNPARVAFAGWGATIVQATAGSQTFFEILDGTGGATTFSNQFSLYMSALPTGGNHSIIGARSTTNAQLGSVQIGTDGIVRVIRPSGATVTPIGTVPLSATTDYTFSYYGVGGSTTLGEAHIRIWNTSSGALVDSIDATGFDMTTGLIDRFRYGKNTAQAFSDFTLSINYQNIGTNTPYGFPYDKVINDTLDLTDTATPLFLSSSVWNYGYDVRIG
jgi:hypothetical protein